MCPSHVEHFIDSNLLKSTRLTERLKLWNKFARQPVDTETVRTDFFRKARTGKLFQKSKIRRPLETRLKVWLIFQQINDAILNCGKIIIKF